MYLAKAWMAKATGDPADLEAAKSVYDQFASNLDYNRHAVFLLMLSLSHTMGMLIMEVMA